jgi:hypothetical protein
VFLSVINLEFGSQISQKHILSLQVKKMHNNFVLLEYPVLAGRRHACVYEESVECLQQKTLALFSGDLIFIFFWP